MSLEPPNKDEVIVVLSTDNIKLARRVEELQDELQQRDRVVRDLQKLLRERHKLQERAERIASRRAFIWLRKAADFADKLGRKLHVKKETQVLA